jgi:hypothetical protein
MTFFTHLRVNTFCLALLSLVGLPFIISAQAQRPNTDYVVTTAGDTLRGRIQLTGRAATVVHLHQRGQPTTTYTASQIRSYGTGRTPLRVSKPVGQPAGRPQLLVPLVRGYMSLYAGKDSTASQVRYYLQPADSAYVVEVPPTTALITYARLLSACSSLNIGSNGFMARYRYTHSGLIALTTDYNRCLQKPSELAKTPSGVHAQFGIKGGMGFPTFSPILTDFYAQTVFGPGAQNTSSYQAGAVALFTTRSNWGLQIEANYLRLAGTYPLPTQPASNQGTYVGLYGVKLRYSQLQVPLLVHYTFSPGAIAPYLNLGPSLAINVSNGSTKQLVDGNGSPTGEQVYDTGGSAAILGGAAGVGCLLRIKGGPALLLEGRYDLPLDWFGNNTLARSLRLEAGILF